MSNAGWLAKVHAYAGPFAIEVRLAAQPQDGTIFECSIPDCDTTYDVQQALLEVAFPRLHRALEAARNEDDGEPSEDAWATAFAAEVGRDLAPSSEWAESVRDWWEARTGVRADRSAALRDMQGITIRGEPTIETPEQRKLFDQAQQKIMQNIANRLMTPTPAAKRARRAPKRPITRKGSPRAPKKR